MAHLKDLMEPYEGLEPLRTYMRNGSKVATGALKTLQAYLKRIALSCGRYTSKTNRRIIQERAFLEEVCTS